VVRIDYSAICRGRRSQRWIAFFFGDVSESAVLFVEDRIRAGICDLQWTDKTVDDFRDGKSIIVRIAERVSVGLAETLSGQAYELTAEAMEPYRELHPRDAFLQFLREHAEAAVASGADIERIYHATLLEVRYLDSQVQPRKNWRGPLDLRTQPSATNGHLRATLTLTPRKSEKRSAHREKR